MKRLLPAFYKSATIRDSGILLFGYMISAFLGFILTLILTRYLTPSDFGIFVTVIIYTQLLSRMFEFGARPVILNFYSGDNRDKNSYLKAALISSVSLTLIVSVILYLLSPYISRVFFSSVEIVPYLKFSIIGVICLIFTYFGLGFFQAKRYFIEAMMTNASINLSKIIILILAIWILGKSVNPIFLYFLYQIAFLAPILFISLRVDWKFLKNKIKPKYFTKIAKFALPTAFADVFMSAYRRIDQFVVFSILGSYEAGIYGLAFQLNLAIIFFSNSLRFSTISRFVYLKDTDFKVYFSKTILLSLGVVVLIALSIPLVSPFLLLIFGEAFSRSALPLQILLLGTAFSLISLPFGNAILYKLKKPWIQALVHLSSLIVVIYFFIILLPRYGIIGVAISVSVMYFFELLLTLLFYYLLSKDRISFKDIYSVAVSNKPAFRKQ